MYIGLGLIVGGFLLFLYSQMRLRQLDIEEFKNQQLTKSFNKAKNISCPNPFWISLDYIFNCVSIDHHFNIAPNKFSKLVATFLDICSVVLS